MGYGRAQEGPGKYLNPKFEIGYLQRAGRLCMRSRNSANEKKEPLAVWNKNAT